MAKKPNYDFERRERERLKKKKNEERALAKQAPGSADDGAKSPDEQPSREDD